MFASPNSHPKSVSHVSLGGGGLLGAENRKVYSGQPSLTEELLEGVDITVITTAHSCVDYDFVQQHSLIVFDTRNAMRDAKDRSNIVLL